MGLINFIRSNKYIKKYNTNSIIIFSEGNIYYTTNKPIIDELIKKIDVLYITIDKDDKLLTYNNDRFHSIYIEFDFWGQLLMATIQGRLLITTTPSLHVLALKKSPNIKHYSYFMHAPGDIHYYQKHSFDYFDSIVCVGDYQIKSLEYLENKRKMKIKEKISLGFSYGDKYYKEITQLTKHTDNKELKTILIAPSWGNNNILNKIDYDIFEIAFNAGFNIIYRPHLMSLNYEKKIIDSILNKYINGFNNLKFTFDTAHSGINSILNSSVLLSGLSGIVSDYILFAQKPAIVYDIHSNKNIKNIFENDDLDYIPWNFRMFEDTSYIFKTRDDLVQIFNRISSGNYDKKNIISKYISDIANFGSSSKRIAQYYIAKFHAL